MRILKLISGANGRSRTDDRRFTKLIDSVLPCAARYDSVHLFDRGLYLWCYSVLPSVAEWISKRLAKCRMAQMAKV